MAISPLSARSMSPGGKRSPGGERRRARLALAIATIGVVAMLLAYAISPGVRHAVSHAAHTVKHTVGNVFDHDHGRDDRRTTTRHSAAKPVKHP
jgi:hypothetical protein